MSFLCLWLLLLRAEASSGIFHCSAGHGWVRPSIAAFVDVSSSHQHHGFAKAYFEDPRRVDLKARSGQLAKSRIMLVDFEFLYLLGKERDGPRVEEEGALRRPCLKIRFPQSVSHPSTCSAGPLWEPRYRFWGLGG